MSGGVEEGLSGERLIAFVVITSIIGIAFTAFSLVAFYSLDRIDQREKQKAKNQLTPSAPRTRHGCPVPH
jgi:hypothetical protein